METLTFGQSKGNSKIRQLAKMLGKRFARVATFTLPAGHACPGALTCLAQANRRTGKLTDGSAQLFRCFEASSESRYKAVRRMAWRNYTALLRAGTAEVMTALILRSIPERTEVIRVHIGGDYFSQAYLDAWIAVAYARPDLTLYSYTKSISFFLKRTLPAHFRVTASRGGRQDHLIAASGLRTATVVYSIAEAKALGLEIDHDDSHAQGKGSSFALLIHGSQRAGSNAARALQALR